MRQLLPIEIWECMILIHLSSKDIQELSMVSRSLRFLLWPRYFTLRLDTSKKLQSFSDFASSAHKASGVSYNSYSAFRNDNWKDKVLCIELPGLFGKSDDVAMLVQGFRQLRRLVLNLNGKSASKVMSDRLVQIPVGNLQELEFKIGIWSIEDGFCPIAPIKNVKHLVIRFMGTNSKDYYRFIFTIDIARRAPYESISIIKETKCDNLILSLLPKCLPSVKRLTLEDIHGGDEELNYDNLEDLVVKRTGSLLIVVPNVISRKLKYFELHCRYPVFLSEHFF
jgi:hypothetical protein